MSDLRTPDERATDTRIHREVLTRPLAEECPGDVIDYDGQYWLCPHCGVHGDWGTSWGHPEQPPPYSTDWGAAGPILEHYAARGIIIRVGPWVQGWCAYLSWAPRYFPEDAQQFVAATGPLAICRAALAVVDSLKEQP